MKISFIKMNGSGNDFVVIDARKENVELLQEQICLLSSRENSKTKGCDQLILLRHSEKADLFMQIYNSDGKEVDACGNATRCVADLLYREQEKLPLSIETNAAILYGIEINDNNEMLVNMGKPRFAWADIPITTSIDEAPKILKEKFGVERANFANMGNPHVVFFVETLPSNEEITDIGRKIENYTEIFPQRVNVSFASPSDTRNIAVKIWERGAGLTKACGTGACAILATANRICNFFTNVQISFANSGESVSVKFDDKGNILLGGKVEMEFEDIADV